LFPLPFACKRNFCVMEIAPCFSIESQTGALYSLEWLFQLCKNVQILVNLLRRNTDTVTSTDSSPRYCFFQANYNFAAFFIIFYGIITSYISFHLNFVKSQTPLFAHLLNCYIFFSASDCSLPQTCSAISSRLTSVFKKTLCSSSWDS
jgi:hypothetical protein